jgi:serine protease Do
MQETRQINRALIFFLVILSFVTGVAGGIGGIAVVSGSESLQNALGISQTDGLSLGSAKVESVTLKEDSSVISAVKKVSPSVVSVVYTKDVTVINPFSFGSPFGQQDQTTQQQQGGGTGFVVTADGLIATNKHVANVDGAKYTVITQDGKKYDAEVLAKDSANDFAILKIDAKNLPVVEYGDSDSLDIGQRVIAIGNALGEFQNSVTVGVLSGEERTIEASDSTGTGTEELEGLLQTDAAINEGNSGGPLVNTKGQVIGINTATASKSEAEGIGFAIPINSLKTALESVKKNGKIVRAYLGVSTVTIDQKIAALRGISESKGALVIGDTASGVAAVESGSAADKAGIKEGDIILKVNGDEIAEGKSLKRVLSQYQPNDEVTILILRGSDRMELKAKLGEAGSK